MEKIKNRGEVLNLTNVFSKPRKQTDINNT